MPSSLEFTPRILLPESLLQRVKTDCEITSGGQHTLAYKRMTDILRRLCHNWTTSYSPNNISGTKLNKHAVVYGFTPDSERMLLHYAAMFGDVLLTYEYLYQGATPDLPDANGFTPVFMALYGAARQKADPDIDIPTYRGLPKSEITTILAKRLSRIARILIDQHIDVNQSHGGFSLLKLALLAKDWDTTTLLLNHGANTMSAQELQSCLPNGRDRTKFLDLVRQEQLPDGQSRPPRVCPCWSEESLENCHGKPGARIAYPRHYLCFCGKDKTYGKCCESKIAAVEYWDENKGRITCHTDNFVSATDPLRAAVRRVQALDFDDDTKSVYSASDIPFSGLTQERLDRFRTEMIERNMVDPAFAYGMSRMRFPLPCNRSYGGRGLRVAHQTNWNKAIDDYINEGSDPRSRFDIERAAKIGTWGGALIRSCLAEDCIKLEMKDIKKFQQCSACKIAVYCSSECQKAHWEKHKLECMVPTQSPEFLPSQKNIIDYLADRLTEMR